MTWIGRMAWFFSGMGIGFASVLIGAALIYAMPFDDEIEKIRSREEQRKDKR